MRNGTRSVVRAARAVSAAGIILAGLYATAASPAAARGATLSSWAFEGVTTTNTGASPIASAGTLASDTGNGLFTALHANAGTAWSNPAGNGSPKSVSANNWAVGDYWQWTSDTTGQAGIAVRFDAVGSNTGPRDFELRYSSTGPGGAFTTASAYMTAATPSFNTSTELTSTPPRFAFDLSAVAALDNNPDVVFRLVVTSTVSNNGGTLAGTGTSRVDNVLVTSARAIPEPGAAALTMLAGAALRRRRRD